MLPTVKAFFADQTDVKAITTLKSWFPEETMTTYKQFQSSVIARALLAHAGESDYVLDIDLAAVRLKSMGPEEWGWIPVFESLRQNPRYQEYLEKADIIQYWDATTWPDWCRRNDDGKVECK
jgi:hypothetical protein